MAKNTKTDEYYFSEDSTESPAFDLMESNLFGDVDVTNLPELGDGTYSFRLNNVEAFMLKNNDDEDERYIQKAMLVFKWSMSEEESPAYGEEVQSRHIIYPVLNMNELPAQKRTEVYRSVRKLKGFLAKLGYDLRAGVNPKSLKEDLSGTVARIEIYHKYSEKTDTTYRNIRSIERITREVGYEPDF